MGRIYNTITGFNEFMSIAFNEAYTMPPTTEGTAGNLTKTAFSNDSAVPVFEYSKGPFPGEGSWRFKSISGYGNTRIKNQYSNLNSNSLHQLVSSDNYTLGFWLKMNQVYNTSNTTSSVQIQRALSTYGTTNSSYGITATTMADSLNPTYYGIGLVNTPNGTQIIYTDENNNQIVKDKWYFVALRTTTVFDSGTSQYIRTQKFYINGALKINYQNNNFSSGNINSLYWGFVSGGSAFADVNIADWFIADSSIITETDIQTIWNSSKPIQLPIKYYDGTTFATPTDTKVYYDSQWNPIYANQWNGTSWVQV